MTRVTRSRYRDGFSLAIKCPCCRRELVATTDYDDDCEVSVQLEAVPLRDQPCTVSVGVCIDFKQFRVFAGNECNWLCNVPAHVTPCDASHPSGRRRPPSSYGPVRLCGVGPTLARCVQ